jgi:hypothetical protein
MRTLVAVISTLGLSMASAGLGAQGAMSSLENGLQIGFRGPRTDGPPATDEARFQHALFGAPNGAMRVITDVPQRRYFAYWVTAEPLQDKQSARVRVGPVPREWERRWLQEAWGILCPSCPEPLQLSAGVVQYPDPVVVPVGSELRVDVLENPDTGERIYDIVSVTWPRGPVIGDELELRNAGLRVDHDLLDNQQSCQGEIVFFYVRGAGRVLVSRWPRVGFERPQAWAGGWDDLITLRAGGRDFEWRSEGLVLGPRPAPDSFQLMWSPFVRYEPNWRPAPADEPGAHSYLAGSVDPNDYPRTTEAESVPAPAEGQPEALAGFSVDLWVEPSKRPGGPFYRCRLIVRDSATGAWLAQEQLEVQVGDQGMLTRPIPLAGEATARLLVRVSVNKAESRAFYGIRIVQSGLLRFSQSATLSIG